MRECPVVVSADSSSILDEIGTRRTMGQQSEIFEMKRLWWPSQRS